jgi:uncharacterized protein
MTTEIEPISAAPPRPVRLVTQAQDWRNTVFLHWEVDPDAARSKLPDHTEVDLFEGRSYVGLICIDIRVALLGLVAVPYLSSFAEVNVRLYSVDREGRRGIVFCSLDADRLVPSVAGRAGYGLPYMWSDVRAEHTADQVSYRCRRRWPTAGPSTELTVRVGEPLSEPTMLEHFLTARWAMHWSRAGHGWRATAQHEPWPLYSAELISLDDRLIEAAGLPAPTDDPISVLWSPGVRAKIGPPERF